LIREEKAVFEGEKLNLDYGQKEKKVRWGAPTHSLRKAGGIRVGGNR